MVCEEEELSCRFCANARCHVKVSDLLCVSCWTEYGRETHEQNCAGTADSLGALVDWLAVSVIAFSIFRAKLGFPSRRTV